MLKFISFRFFAKIPRYINTHKLLKKGDFHEKLT